VNNEFYLSKTLLQAVVGFFRGQAEQAAAGGAEPRSLSESMKNEKAEYMKISGVHFSTAISCTILLIVIGLPLAGHAAAEVVAWGSNEYGQTIVPNALTNVTAIAAGSDHSLALTTEGQVVAWGRNDYGQTNLPSSLSNVVAIAAGSSHNLALTAEGRVVAWGNNWAGQTTVPSGLSNVVATAPARRMYPAA